MVSMTSTPNELTDKFVKILNNVCKETHQDWWDVVDSSDFDTVEKRCKKLCKTEKDKELLRNWISEVYDDL